MSDITTWKIYTGNTDAWDAMLSACESATETIELENFIFTSDEIGEKFIKVCEERAKHGVKVRFIWDAAGSFRFFGSSIIEDLKEKGIELVFFKTLLPSIFKFYDYRSWYFRNHRRTLVIDKKIGFTGSVSISKRMENWRDTTVQIEGDVVKSMQKTFELMWIRAQGKRAPRYLVSAEKRSSGEFQYITNAPYFRQHYLYRRTIEAIRNAKTSVYITTPYFIPTRRLARVLQLAAHRGIDVRIILPEYSDFPTVDLAARTFFHGLLKMGIKIYLYKGQIIHSKTIVIDHDWSSVGTLNLDHIALLYNFEANLVTYNQHFADELIAHFKTDMERTYLVTLEEWNRRFFVEKIATFLVKFVRSFL